MPKTPEYLADLNPEQKQAVKCTGGPLLVLAGAGSGKTRTITHKIAYLIGEDICASDRILAVTFTNQAAQEMKKRVEESLRHKKAAPLICTFHSFGARLLRRKAKLLGYSPGFAICDTDDQVRIFKRLYKNLEIEPKNLPIQQVRSIISRAKNRSLDADGYLAQSRGSESEVIFEVFKSYEKYMHRSNFMDFDDLIVLSCRLLRENPEERRHYGTLFQYLLIDEYQDTNGPQYELVKLLTKEHQNITAVGDEDQSIYGFRGANINNILRFEKDFPGATIVKLEQNYRSTQVILDAATAVVSNNLKRKGKVLWTDRGKGEPVALYAAYDSREEAGFVSHAIRRHLQEGAKGIAVLYRTNFQSRQFEEALRRLAIPYKLVGSVSFYHRQEIKDALGYLRLIRNPGDDVSLARVINVPTRGIGQVTQNRLYQLAAESQTTLWDALLRSLEEKVFSPRIHSCLDSFRRLIETGQTFMELPLHVALDKILRDSQYFASLEKSELEQDRNRLLNLNELLNLAREYEDESDPITEFLDHVALRSEVDEYDQSAPVTLMTLHNAKGLEFPVVFLTGCEEGLFPHSRSMLENDLEEERRLCYVGLTRAQKRLYITYSKRRRYFGQDSEELNRPSRFLQEIPENLTQRYPMDSDLQPQRPQPVYMQGSALRSPRGKNRYQGKTYNSVESVKTFLNNRPARKSKFYAGAVVAHEKYGRGQILSVEPAGDDSKITVQFPGQGIKKFRQSFAKLRLI